MNSWKLAVDNLNEIIALCGKIEGNLIERCALYSTARIIISDIRDYASLETGTINGYLDEKIGKAKWHIGAALGFDVDNGHSVNQHCAWAYGAVNIIESLMNENFPEDV